MDHQDHYGVDGSSDQETSSLESGAFVVQPEEEGDAQLQPPRVPPLQALFDMAGYLELWEQDAAQERPRSDPVTDSEMHALAGHFVRVQRGPLRNEPEFPTFVALALTCDVEEYLQEAERLAEAGLEIKRIRQDGAGLELGEVLRASTRVAAMLRRVANLIASAQPSDSGLVVGARRKSVTVRLKPTSPRQVRRGS